MTRAVNDATLQKAGDIYQYLIALRDCFELNDGDTLQLRQMMTVSNKRPIFKRMTATTTTTSASLILKS